MLYKVSELQSLRSRNKQLRDESKQSWDVTKWLGDENKQLRDENNRLRGCLDKEGQRVELWKRGAQESDAVLFEMIDTSQITLKQIVETMGEHTAANKRRSAKGGKATQS
jgi:hypothetical protein